jgi:SAM-dependent methyltransferase
VADGVKETFDAVADEYDAVGVEFFRPIARGLVDALDIRPGERVLDVGCGKGAALVPAAEAAGSATGIDLSPRMVELAKEAAAGLDVDVRVGDAMTPDVEGPFDVVCSSLVLFFLPDPAAALAAWNGLLRDGGRVGVSTFGPYSESWQAVDDVFKPYLPRDLTDPRTTGAESPFASDEGVERLVGSAGFTDVRTITHQLPVRFTDPDQWYRWSMSVGQRRMWMQVPEAERDGVKEQAFDRLELLRETDGHIGFEQTVRYTLARR